ncbi:hypothetical protein QQ045_015970 [Rhodiola kirilowii]
MPREGHVRGWDEVDEWDTGEDSVEDVAVEEGGSFQDDDVDAGDLLEEVDVDSGDDDAIVFVSDEVVLVDSVESVCAVIFVPAAKAST